MADETYYHLVLDLLGKIQQTQAASIHQAALVITRALQAGGVLHVFSTGHSHMMVEEMFYRAGGLVPVNPLFDPGTMLHHGAVKSTQFERLPGYAAVVLNGTDPRAGEPLLIVSNSGINPVPVEMALLAKQRGLVPMAITSVSISNQSKPRSTSGQRLLEVADVVIDNCIQGNDAAVEIDKSGRRAGPLSTLAGAFIVQQVVLEVVAEYQKTNQVPPIFASANVPGGDEWNQQLISQYKDRIKLL